jgi:hypothetical protein
MRNNQRARKQPSQRVCQIFYVTANALCGRQRRIGLEVQVVKRLNNDEKISSFTLPEPTP